MSMSGFPDTLVIRLPKNGLTAMQVVVGILVTLSAQVGEGLNCLRMFLQYSIGFAIFKCIENLVPPIECSSRVDIQSFSYSSDGSTHVHEPNILHPDFLGKMASYPYRPFLFSKGPAIIDTDEPLITCWCFPIPTHMGTATMGATGLLFLGCLGRLWCFRLENLAEN